jgi:hypothetical protein
MKSDSFVRALASISLEAVFNPYRDRCTVHDRSDAPALRRRNLRSYLEALQVAGVDTIWMGRDLGYRGGRRTGLAMTDDYHLHELRQQYPSATFARATLGDALAERTATEIWAALRGIANRPFLWNVFPMHPHEPGNPLSNRRFTTRELATVDDLNAHLIRDLGIRRIVAIGQDAASYGSRYDAKVLAIRHPSYGGVSDFRRGVAEIYGRYPVSAVSQGRQAALFAAS